MVFTDDEETNFFEGDNGLVLPEETREWLQLKGVEHVADLGIQDDKMWREILSEALLPRWVEDDDGDVTRQLPVVLTPKSKKYLQEASHMVRYHNLCNRELTPANMDRKVIADYMLVYDVLIKKKEDDPPSVPVLAKSNGIMNWLQNMKIYLRNRVGTRKPPVPLAYLIRKSGEVEAATPLALGKPYSIKHGSVQKELIHRTPHGNQTEYLTDNIELFSILSKALENTAYAASLEPYEEDENGRSAWMALTNQYAGTQTWVEIAGQSKEWMQNKKWFGTSPNYTLEQFIEQHRAAYQRILKSAASIKTEVPTDQTRVRLFLKNIENTDPLLITIKSQILGSGADNMDGMLNDFERATSHILPYDPTKKLRAMTSKKKNATISSVEVTKAKSMTINGKTVKVGVGKTGVDVRYHTPEEYKKLSDAQRDELQEIRAEKKRKGESTLLPGGPNQTQKGKKGKKTKVTVSSIAAEAPGENGKETEKADVNNGATPVEKATAATVTVGQVISALQSAMEKISGAGSDAYEHKISMSDLISRIKPDE